MKSIRSRNEGALAGAGDGGKTPLPERTLRFSKRMVALSLFLLALGGFLVLGPWRYGMLPGVVLAASGFGTFFTAGYYWGCDNESCS